MSEVPVNRSVIELNGNVNGVPRVVEMDVKSELIKRAEREDRSVSDKELEAESQKLMHDIQRTKEALAITKPTAPLKGILSSFVKK